MKKEVKDFNEYLDMNVKIFEKKKKEPITGRVTIVKKKFLVILAKKPIRKERRIIYKKRSVKLEDIDNICIA